MAEAKSDSGEKKSSKKLILIIGLVVLLLGGAGAGGWYFFMNKPAEDAGHQAEAEKHEEAPKHEEEHAEEVVEPDVYFEIKEPFLVNFPPGSGVKIIKISLTVLVKGEASVEILKKHMPMVRNNLLMAITSIGAEKAKTVEGKKELQALMLSETGKVMEKMNNNKNPVKDVYFTDFVMQ
jgi:flagellar FliL protein